MNRGDGTYAEVAHFAGLESSEWSWTPVFLDVDLDGFEDLLVTTGHARDDMDADTGMRIEALRRSRRMPVAEELGLRKQTPSIASPRLAFRNRGDVTFEEVGAQWGFDQVGVAHGMAVGDLDGDGDMDVVVNNLNGEAGVYRNEGSGGRVGVRLRGEGGNVGGVGARVRLVGGVIGEQSQEMMSGGRYMSGDEGMRVFGSGARKEGMRIEVEWRSGKRSVVEGVKANRVYEVEESGGEMKERKGNGNRKEGVEAWFVDASKELGHVHAEEGYDDYGRQGLLWNRLSQLGPGVGLVDVTGDGREDVVVGSGKGGELGVYENVGGGKFEKRSWGGGVEKRDQSGVAWGGGGELMVGSANYEDGDVKAGSVKGYGKERGDGEGGRAGVECRARGDGGHGWRWVLGVVRWWEGERG